MKHPVYPCLWFDGQAQEAASFYSNVFPRTRVTAVTPMVTLFELDGVPFMGLDGGPQFHPNPSISFFVVCDSEAETDRIWAQLAEGGQVLMPLDRYPWSAWYGFVQDRFGVSWQLSAGKLEDVGQRCTPMLTFSGAQTGRAEEAVGYYTSVFTPSSVTGMVHYEAGEGDREGLVKHAQFRLGPGTFMAMDSSIPHKFGFDEGVSLVVGCDTQEEIDYYWSRLTDGGAERVCGWVQDRFGVCWQIVPAGLGRMMSGDPAAAERVSQAIMRMKKLDIAELERAYDGAG